MSKFQNSFTFEQRRRESESILNKYQGRIPVICERHGRNVPDIDKKKYLVPIDLTMGQFVFIIRRRIKISPETSLFFLVNKKLANLTETMYDLYYKNADPDGFLYMEYTSENVFG